MIYALSRQHCAVQKTKSKFEPGASWRTGDETHHQNKLGVICSAGFDLLAVRAKRSPDPGQLADEIEASVGRSSSKRDAIRVSTKLPPLKRVDPSLREAELVCTAAVTGKKVDDPIFSGLYTYVTADLSSDVEAVKVVALGTEACAEGPGNPTCSGGNPRRLFYSTKSWPKYSVIVELNPSSTVENPVYTVGVARRPRAAMEFFTPLFFDVPFKGMKEWKKEIAPECRKSGP